MQTTHARIELDKIADQIRARIAGELTQARLASGLSKPELAARIAWDELAISCVEEGRGALRCLILVTTVLQIRFVGIEAGPTLAHQLAGQRIKSGLSIAQLAEKVGLAEQTIVMMESGNGRMKDLFRVLAAVAPQVRRRQGSPVWAGAEAFDRDSRFTCPKFMAAIYAAFGPISLDPCGSPLSSVIAARKILLEEGGHGLLDEWSGDLVFVNPPFSGKLDWLKRAFDEWSSGKVKTVLFLSPMMPDALFFHQQVAERCDIFFPQSRIKFTHPDGKQEASKYSLWLVALGATYEQKAGFRKLVKGDWYNKRLYDEFQSSGQSGNSCAGSDRVHRVVCGPSAPIAIRA